MPLKIIEECEHEFGPEVCVKCDKPQIDILDDIIVRLRYQQSDLVAKLNQATDVIKRLNAQVMDLNDALAASRRTND